MEQKSQIPTYFVIDIYKTKIFFSTEQNLLQHATVENKDRDRNRDRDRAILHSCIKCSN